MSFTDIHTDNTDTMNTRMESKSSAVQENIPATDRNMQEARELPIGLEIEKELETYQQALLLRKGLVLLRTSQRRKKRTRVRVRKHQDM